MSGVSSTKKVLHSLNEFILLFIASNHFSLSSLFTTSSNEVEFSVDKLMTILASWFCFLERLGFFLCGLFLVFHDREHLLLVVLVIS